MRLFYHPVGKRVKWESSSWVPIYHRAKIPAIDLLVVSKHGNMNKGTVKCKTLYLSKAIYSLPWHNPLTLCCSVAIGLCSGQGPWLKTGQGRCFILGMAAVGWFPQWQRWGNSEVDRMRELGPFPLTKSLDLLQGKTADFAQLTVRPIGCVLSCLASERRVA